MSLARTAARTAALAVAGCALAGVASDAGLKRRLKLLATTEKRHADAWAELLTRGGVKLPDRQPRLTAQALAALARVAGIGPALALAGAAEGQVLRAYLGQVATVSDPGAQGVLRSVLPEELDQTALRLRPIFERLSRENV